MPLSERRCKKNVHKKQVGIETIGTYAEEPKRFLLDQNKIPKQIAWSFGQVLGNGSDRNIFSTPS